MKTVCFSGWTQAHDALEGIAPGALHIDYAQAESVDAIDVPQHCDLLIGWSLGGVIARRLLEEGRVKAGAFVSIAAPQQFVRSDDYHPAMPQETYQQFFENYATDTQRTLRRFSGLLSKGDKHAAQVRDAMRLHPQADDPQVWLPWLDRLGKRAKQPVQHDVPTLHLHGDQDAIVSTQQAQYDAPNYRSIILPDCAHAPHYHDEAKVRELIADFVAGHVS
jgi:pimeloyl-ACP methyl ester carboxylesterase